MLTYALYLESGPRQRTTMVHVIDLLGCTAREATTQAALAAAPEAVRAYLGFLWGLGEPVDPAAPFSLSIAQHVMEGSWIGYGDPTPGFAPDFDPLREEDLPVYLRRVDGLVARLLHLTGGLPRERMATAPAGSGRSLDHILAHVAESHAVYLRYLVGRVAGLSEALKPVEKDPAAIPAALEAVRRISRARLEALTPQERAARVPHGQVTWSARRAFRRMLEHAWEHCLEIEARALR